MRKRRENAGLERSKCLVIAQVSSVSPKPPDSLGQLGGTSSLLPPPCSLAASHSPAVPGAALTPSVCPCPQCGSGTERVQGSLGFRGTRSWSPEAAGARAIPCPSPPPALQSLWMLPYSCHVLPPPLLLLVAYSSVSPAANSAKQGCIPLPGRIPREYQPEPAPSLGTRHCLLQRDSLALPTPFLCQWREGLREFPPKL